jgi:hypothetical protein
MDQPIVGPKFHIKVLNKTPKEYIYYTYELVEQDPNDFDCFLTQSFERKENIGTLEELYQYLLKNIPDLRNTNVSIIFNNSGPNKDLLTLFKLLSLVQHSEVKPPAGGAIKKYIKIKDRKTPLLVKVDKDKKKYVMLNKTKTFLSQINYRYVKK